MVRITNEEKLNLEQKVMIEQKNTIQANKTVSQFYQKHQLTHALHNRKENK
ncbi:hypothetical protein [Bacillus mycoides]|uniref:hypothetical protein n=1 Tax=Bacillus mycoides TaxID=1405 RepID=UPI001E6598C1|nr:hypothetical protein [Bacillus mycoides]